MAFSVWIQEWVVNGSALVSHQRNSLSVWAARFGSSVNHHLFSCHLLLPIIQWLLRVGLLDLSKQFLKTSKDFEHLGEDITSFKGFWKNNITEFFWWWFCKSGEYRRSLIGGVAIATDMNVKISDQEKVTFLFIADQQRFSHLHFLVWNIVS